MKKNIKTALVATTGFVIGGAISYLTVNATAEHRSGSDVLKLHDEPLHYMIDAGCAIVCAGVLTLLMSVNWRRSTLKHDQVDTRAPLLTQSPLSSALKNDAPTKYTLSPDSLLIIKENKPVIKQYD